MQHQLSHLQQSQDPQNQFKSKVPTVLLIAENVGI